MPSPRDCDPNDSSHAEQLARLKRLLARCPQKRAIIARMAEGDTNPQIAECLGRTVHDVHSLLQGAFDAVELHDRFRIALLYRELYPAGSRHG